MKRKMVVIYFGKGKGNIPAAFVLEELIDSGAEQTGLSEKKLKELKKNDDIHLAVQDLDDEDIRYKN